MTFPVLIMAALTFPAWQGTIDAQGAARLFGAYTNNELVCEWAGTSVGIRRFMPANLGFRFAIAGDADVTNRVGKVLREIRGATDPEIRDFLEKHGLFASYVQTLVRSARAKRLGLSNVIDLKAHPSVFEEADFNRDDLIGLAKCADFSTIASPVAVQIVYQTKQDPIGRAEPGVDYPDFMPEEVYSFPFGACVILRAPEKIRRFRLYASAWPRNAKVAKYIWRTSSYAKVSGYRFNPKLTTDKGYLEIEIDVGRGYRRVDVAVFAVMESGAIGPPSFVSFYRSPYELRTYSGNGAVEKVEYCSDSSRCPYDLSKIWVPRDWTDYYVCDPRGNVVSYSRARPGSLRSDEFSNTGELICETFASDRPKVTQRVQYYVNDVTGLLDYKPIGELIRHTVQEPRTRNRGW